MLGYWSWQNVACLEGWWAAGLSGRCWKGGCESLGWVPMGRVAGVEVLCWCGEWKEWERQTWVVLQLAHYLGSSLLEAAKLEVGGNSAVSKRCENPASCHPVSCGEQLRPSWVWMFWTEKGKAFFLRRAYMELYEHRSAGGGWLV